MKAPTFGSLFSGYGGLDLGFEKKGFKCRWQVEISEDCRRVLAKHWPSISRFNDIRDFGGKYNLSQVDCIVLGFPCTDISGAGLRAGIEGKNSGLWAQAWRVIRDLRPWIVVVENVAKLLEPIKHGGTLVEPAPIGRVLGDLATLGYDAEWDSIPAYVLGADHFRDRTFIIAYPSGSGWTRVLRGEAIHVPEPIFGPRTDASLGAARNLVRSIEKRLGQPSVLRVPDGLSNQLGRLTGNGNAVHVKVAEFIAGEIMNAWAISKRS